MSDYDISDGLLSDDEQDVFMDSDTEPEVMDLDRPDNGKGKGRDMHGHTDQVWALAISPDGRYLASGGKDRLVGVWDVEKDEWVKGFTGHRDHISVRRHPLPFARSL